MSNEKYGFWEWLTDQNADHTGVGVFVVIMTTLIMLFTGAMLSECHKGSAKADCTCEGAK